jgi:hypothetical protein
MSGYPTSTAMVSTQHPSQAKHPKVYQIDFTAVASGKRIASTKRRVRWYVLGGTSSALGLECGIPPILVKSSLDYHA